MWGWTSTTSSAPSRLTWPAGQPAPVAQLAATLRAKLWTRVSEGAVTVTAATVLNTELSALARSAADSRAGPTRDPGGPA